jgi:hypothetical protein
MVPVANRDRCSFPVRINQADYIRRGLRQIKGINSSAATIIEGLQPLNSGDTSAPLYILNRLWNRDKHQILNFVGVPSMLTSGSTFWRTKVHVRSSLMSRGGDSKMA